jgi:hypothetical protein
MMGMAIGQDVHGHLLLSCSTFARRQRCLAATLSNLRLARTLAGRVSLVARLSSDVIEGLRAERGDQGHSAPKRDARDRNGTFAHRPPFSANDPGLVR